MEDLKQVLGVFKILLLQVGESKVGVSALNRQLVEVNLVLDAVVVALETGLEGGVDGGALTAS